MDYEVIGRCATVERGPGSISRSFSLIFSLTRFLTSLNLSADGVTNTTTLKNCENLAKCSLQSLVFVMLVVIRLLRA